MVDNQGSEPRRGIAVALAVVAAVAVGVALLLFLRDDDTDVVVDPGGSDTTTTSAVSTTTTSTTSTTSSTTTSTTSGTTTTVAISGEEAVNVVWPAPEGDLRYGEAMEAVKAFAEDLVGFTDPLYGDYVGGDARSGEVEVRADEAGAVTTVFVRKLSDDNWWVLGAATDDIVLDDPVPGTAIDDPLLLSGQARVFEGTVQVSVFERGDTSPLGEGFVTAGGSAESAPFEGEIRWQNPGGGWGAVVLYTESAENGHVSQATAIPVGFIGGD